MKFILRQTIKMIIAIVGIKKNEETVFELNNNFWEDINNWSSKLRNRNIFL